MASIFPVADMQTVKIPVGDATLTGDVVVPPGARGLIVFAHGSGSSRTSSRNRRVARVLNHGGFGTLLFDLLTPAEEAADQLTGHLRFDIEFLANRLGDTLDWTKHEQHVPARLGLFGASTGAAAALMASVRHADRVAAVVSRGGRPDLAADALPHVTAPTLLIVGGSDTEVIQLNKAALALLRCEKDLVLVDRATHLFEEPGTLDEVARLALDWFDRHLVPE
jgi:putative phosphoribosyl transferase